MESACSSSSSWGKDKWGPALLSASNQRARIYSQVLWFNICIYDIMVQWQLPSTTAWSKCQPRLAQKSHSSFWHNAFIWNIWFLDDKRHRLPGNLQRGLEDGAMTIRKNLISTQNSTMIFGPIAVGHVLYCNTRRFKEWGIFLMHKYVTGYA